MTVRRNQRHAAAQPDRPATAFHRILDQTDRQRRMRLNGLAGNLVEGNEAPGRAIVDLAQKNRAYVWVVGARDLVSRPCRSGRKSAHPHKGASISERSGPSKTNACAA